jgi:hypothetical protein
VQRANDGGDARVAQRIRVILVVAVSRVEFEACMWDEL